MPYVGITFVRYVTTLHYKWKFVKVEYVVAKGRFRYVGM